MEFGVVETVFCSLLIGWGETRGREEEGKERERYRELEAHSLGSEMGFPFPSNTPFKFSRISHLDYKILGGGYIIFHNQFCVCVDADVNQ